MICDWYEYTLLSPMHAGVRKPYGRFMECADYVPGSVIRGACAEAILRGCPGRQPKDDNPQCPRNGDDCPAWDGSSQRCLFAEVFADDDDGLLFTSAYAVPQDALHSRPAPLTLRQCARTPGTVEDYQRRLRAAEDHDDVEFSDPPHGLWDTLISGYALECRERAALQKGQLPDPEAPVSAAIAHGERCPKCPHKAERVPGYLAQMEGESGTFWVAHSPSKERRMHVALNRSRRSAESGLLFSREAVHRGTVFRGQVIADERQRALLEVARRALAPRLGEPLVFGRGGAAGLGHAMATWLAPLKGESLNDRLRALNDAVQTLIPRAEKTYFAVDALAPLLVGPVPETDWAGVLGIPGVIVVRRVQALTTVSGWSCRPDDGSFGERQTSLAVAAGSVFLCLCEGKPEDLANRLAPLEETGVGEQRMRGYGRIEFSSRVHLLMP